ncbi:hypothetical protein M378DRAFT_69338 [Amanita muscaria Koide BX008]|uniref:Uncharacterized protein n=1 Tax=Amanita muscaria (strain Koide BX008) TaxID=946122 RepID=A0A0C2X637_AMAMK|nr:hypothetical protein M378DRAFT_69338 [Amanita muscaria Koide BX008]
MDVDESKSERSVAKMTTDSVFAKSDELTASFYANSALEVRQILRSADFYRDAYTGEIDTVTGFSLVASVQTCFVWQHAQPVRPIPTCYIFSCPSDVLTTAPPFHALVPYGLNREPGLILLSVTGVIRFWDSIGIGLAGGDHYHTANLNLPQNENITNFIRSDATTYIASTSLGRLFRVTLTSSGVDDQLKFHSFAPAASSLSLTRLFPSIFASTSAQKLPESGNINSVALGAWTPSGGRELWALIETRIQKWCMHPEGWEELLLDHAVLSLISESLLDPLKGNHRKERGHLDLELLDIAVDGDGKLIVLVSYAGAEEDNYVGVETSAARRVYALVKLTRVNDEFEVNRFTTVPYQSTSSSGAPMHPRIKLVLGGVIVIVQFGDAVALCARESEYRDRLELKSITDRTLGIGVVQSDSTFLLLTASLMMKIYIDVDKVQTFDPHIGHTNLIKSIMTQAILYGAIPKNPLYFSFPPEVDEEHLMQGAEQLSQAILESDSTLVQRDHDLSAQITARKEKLSWLIGFINDNGVLVKISQKSRQKLGTDAEKLYAAHQLWLWYNSFLASSPTRSVLNDAVYAYMEEVGDLQHEDVMRAFFRSRISEVGKLIKRVMKVALQAPAELDPDLNKSLPETNRIVLTLLQSAFEYREYNMGVYGVQRPMIKPWSSRPSIIDAVLGLFDTTTKVVDKPLPDKSLLNVGNEPSSQLPELAEILFACVQERLDWLGSAVAAEESGTVADKDELEQKFALLRPEVLETLRRTGHNEAAFSLAEKYRDFSSLAALCHRDTVYPPEENPNIERIQKYMDRFKYEFAQELYKWYIQHAGELRVLFAQEEISGGYMDRFFAEHPNNSIAWLNDLGKERYGTTATSLLAEAEKSNNLEVSHLMLSVGKLSYLEQTFDDSERAEDGILDAFHNGLDFISVHETLLQGLKTALSSLRGRQSLDHQVDVIIKVKAPSLLEQKAFLQNFKDDVRQLLQGKVLSTEDMVDIMTLKDNTNSVEDYSIALNLLTRTQRKNIPEARRESAFRTVWRRVYVHDDWDSIRKTANISDRELTLRYRSTALYATLCAIIQDENADIPYVSPDEALIIPSSIEIVSRWPGMSAEQVEAIVQDYDFERDQLGDYDLNDVYHRVRELAEEDVSWRQSP